MTIFEILKFNREILERLQKAGVRHCDVCYIDLYSDYIKLVSHKPYPEFAPIVLRAIARRGRVFGLRADH
ncbi:MAG: hypothetical protein K2L77_06705 [Muribaculaceae bacterium]|nr:hypothetical protein [Muribaculaceae bacterium]